MTKRMLIDATHSEETRMVVLSGNRLEEFDFETAAKRPLKGNIYLARVTRVEPSLQAAFVEYGGNRHGFLAFNEVHPDYYRIPIADRAALISEMEAEREENGSGNGDNVEILGGDDVEDVARRRPRLSRQYKIQEVIKRRQIMLVQVTKEERGTKGAALTTYLSLPGRYCVLMPNTSRGGGVSRKITNAGDRKRLKKIVEDLEVPEGMAVIVRTAGSERSKAEIKRDFDYLIKLWSDIRDLTLQSNAPALIYEEGNLIKRALRDIYGSEIEEVQVEGDEGYKIAKAFMKDLIPSHAKKVQQYKDPSIPLFQRYQVENQLDAIHSPSVQLKSGGYIVLNQTEALVAIDVNSGRSTRERNIEETAYRTNLEAAEEVARQLRLRDLSGLIVIDFIDMEENRNQLAVERKLKEAMKVDRARIQIGRISHFGLLELSRQRLRPSVFETSNLICPHCGGTGHIRSTDSTALHVLRAIEEEGIRQRASEIAVYVPTPVALYILNQKRAALAQIEERHSFAVTIGNDDSLIPPNFRLERVKTRTTEEQQAALKAEAARSEAAEAAAAEVAEDEDEDIEEIAEQEDAQDQAAASSDREGERDSGREGERDSGREGERDSGREGERDSGREGERDSGREGERDSGREGGRRRRRRRGRGSRDGAGDQSQLQGDADQGDEDSDAEASTDSAETAEASGGERPDNNADNPEDSEEERQRKRRRRGRRGGRRRRRGGQDGEMTAAEIEAADREDAELDAAEAAEAAAAAAQPAGVAEEAEAAPAKPKRSRRGRGKAAGVETETVTAEAPAEAEPVAAEADAAPQPEAAAEKPKRSRSRKKPAPAGEAEAGTVAETSPEDAAAAKPKRSRSRKKPAPAGEAEAGTVAETSPEDAAAAKPKRSRSRKKPAPAGEAEAGTVAETSPEDAAAAKPKRSRSRKKPEAAPETPVAETPAAETPMAETPGAEPEVEAPAEPEPVAAQPGVQVIGTPPEPKPNAPAKRGWWNRIVS
ncbi:Rne/Rng family ribonuclease [Oceanibaculum pacificum]|uniref:Rne/Rng family ribonuclease n=1 Tax=Oceanibaculum pacificum TaxID=580166 RepID=UPI000831C904|nr:ribonuclease E/G [Oceanibaculum pacificum]